MTRESESAPTRVGADREERDPGGSAWRVQAVLQERFDVVGQIGSVNDRTRTRSKPIASVVPVGSGCTNTNRRPRSDLSMYRARALSIGKSTQVSSSVVGSHPTQPVRIDGHPVAWRARACCNEQAAAVGDVDVDFRGWSQSAQWGRHTGHAGHHGREEGTLGGPGPAILHSGCHGESGLQRNR